MNRQNGLALLELIIVMMIGLILVAVLTAAIGTARESSRSTQCIFNLKQFGAATQLFGVEHQNRFPAYIENPGDATNPNGGAQQWDFQLFPYLGYQTISNHNSWWTANAPLHRVFYCPSSLMNATRPERSRSYWFNRSLARDTAAKGANGSFSKGIPVSRVTAPAKTAMIMELGHPAGGNDSLYLGGGVNNVMYFHDSIANAQRNPYFRHRGRINILFADGHVAGHGPADPHAESGWPEEVIITN